YYDYISARHFDDSGNYAGEHIFIGHFTSTVFHTNLRDVPWLRLKLKRILDRAPFHAESHSGRALVNALENLPRESIFHFGVEDLLRTGTEVSRAEERRKVSLFLHRERYGRFLSCLVLVPRSRFSTQTRDRVQRILVAKFEAADCEFSVQLSASRLARVNFVLRVDPNRWTDDGIDVQRLESELNEATRAWSDRLQDAIRDSFGEEHGPVLARRYVEAFKQDFQEHYTCEVAAVDIEKVERLGESNPVSISMYRPLELAEPHVKLRLYERGNPTSLSTTLETLENMGLTVSEARPSRLDPKDSPPMWIHDFSATHNVTAGLDVDATADRFVEAFLRISRGDVENDALNRLVIFASLTWRDVVLLRTYSQYLRQTSTPFSRAYMRETLWSNPEITFALVELFHARFDPDRGGTRDTSAHVARIESLLTGVESLDEDRILRSFLAVILATLRTNYYQVDAHGAPKSWVSVKLDPSVVPDLPAPRPKFEVFVYSPRVEGIHLRAGKIARGGLRWSDRREDFRTEVLGLVKAQTIKNAVIIPHGAKGGFVPKKLDEAPDRLAEGIECYKTFIRALLDLTDNLSGSTVLPPPRVVRRDEDDPYLVVAADKGTASFSDIANEIASEYSFWLGDAFASGGSVGYDHKAMGITARGAWESVMRHFRELGIDTQTMPFTAIGIGDMSGDVFGNGMLRSPHIRLVAAFNHAHVFLDPDPDAQRSFEERARLFREPGSSWSDYDTQCLSPGGAIFSRSAKSVSLSPQACAAL
ncbi:MAG TPA: NAD-glutamate dehydrogenase domain-containing protein, partial [Gammaproteobacteria bacterium]|nr:NAD-glutamate dehydrogenase domain-containing protein [Gammaproteobacteria bacterium]